MPDRYISLSGTPFEMGKTYGAAVRGVFQAQAHRYLEEGLAQEGFLSCAQLRSAAERFLDTAPWDLVQEFEGFAEGANVSVVRVAEWHMVAEGRIRCSTVVAFPEGQP